MKLTRPRLLVLLLLGATVAWLGLLGLEQLYRDPPNYARVEDGLYLGGLLAEPPPGTSAVLNLCEQADPYCCAHQLWEPIADAEPAPDLDWLRRVVDFLRARRRAGDTVYVHCRNGVSRSGMVVTAYVMAEKGWGCDRALAFVRARRPGLRPNPVFLERLLEWERVLSDAGRSGGRLLFDSPGPSGYD